MNASRLNIHEQPDISDDLKRTNHRLASEKKQSKSLLVGIETLEIRGEEQTLDEGTKVNGHGEIGELPQNDPPSVPVGTKEKIPKHIAIIMDGNGRWATRKGLRREEGHKAGLEATKRTVKAAEANGIDFLTLYVFSSDNWKRSESEVSNIMNLLCECVLKRIEELCVKITVIGNRSRLDPEIQKLLLHAETSCAHNKFHLILAINYGGRNEIRNAAFEMCKYAISNNIKPNMIADIPFDKFIDCDIPDPDLLIRTAGEKRVSDFLLWQIAYTELYFSDVLWPDFSEADLADAIKDFSARHRKFGESN